MSANLLKEEPVTRATSKPHPIPDPQPLENYYEADQPLQLALSRYLQADSAAWGWADQYLREWGGICAQQVEPLCVTADRNIPALKQYDRRGERVDELIFHPAYHEIGKLAYGAGIAAMSNRPGFRGLTHPASHLVKFAAMYEFTQSDGSVGCPLSMTDIMARVLNKYASRALIERYVPRLTSTDYETLYTGAMFMTEKVGGSDVGATTTVARPTGEFWELSGDKWFCSNVGADLILTLARPEGGPAGTRGLGLFLVPRLLPDGTRNSYSINRLKDKLGTRAMASGEVTLNNAKAYLIEPLERGFVMMMEMVNGTRLHSGVAGAAALRRSVVEAVQHARERMAFGRPLAEQPLMAEQLADLIVDSAAATSLMLATANALDKADADPTNLEARTLSRLLISLLKRYATSHGVKGAQTALEIRGGNGYIEDWPNARLLRDAYVQIIWEGGVNMVSFDVLRAMERENAWTVFRNTLEKELAEVDSAELQETVAQLRQSLLALQAEVARIATVSRDAQEIASPQLAETMAALYSAAMLASEANFSLKRGDQEAARNAQTARRYHERFVLPALSALSRCQPASSEATSLIKGAI
ncbi:MAG TPA: acyl-CoA dehydrogenase family protein [Chloroflexia bacterium]|nr:acyl-CoA dehydrogenase family protein [Chloroflexia bacterium]